MGEPEWKQQHYRCLKAHWGGEERVEALFVHGDEEDANDQINLETHL